jgi:sugar O-acyltransferase, sialic acid O-acetyltransferase NeuD family
MYLYGASGHAKVILDILESSNIEVKGFIDDNSSLNNFMQYVVHHTIVNDMFPIIISIGNNCVRKMIASKLSCTFGKVISNTAIVSKKCKISEGTVVMQGAIIQSDTTIGSHCIINTGSSIDHECLIGNFVHISPHATLCGNVCVGEGAWIGAGATIIQGVTIGAWAIIGAGAVVIKDVPDNAVVAGVPAKVIKTR